MHCVEHLVGMNCVHPQFIQIRDQFDEFVCNRASRCLHSITLASLTILRTPASTNWSGWRRSKAGDRAPAQPRHVAQVAVAWHRRGCPVPGPPSLSLTTLLSRQPHRSPQEPEPAVRASCGCTPSAARELTEHARAPPLPSFLHSPLRTPLSPLPLLEATRPPRSPRTCAPASARARRAPWPTVDDEDARLDLHCLPRHLDMLIRTYDLDRKSVV